MAYDITRLIGEVVWPGVLVHRVIRHVRLNLLLGLAPEAEGWLALHGAAVIEALLVRGLLLVDHVRVTANIGVVHLLVSLRIDRWHRVHAHITRLMILHLYRHRVHPIVLIRLGNRLLLHRVC